MIVPFGSGLSSEMVRNGFFQKRCDVKLTGSISVTFSKDDSNLLVP